MPLETASRAELDVNVALIAESTALPGLVPIRDHAYRQLLEVCTRLVELLTGTTDRSSNEPDACTQSSTAWRSTCS